MAQMCAGGSEVWNNFLLRACPSVEDDGGEHGRIAMALKPVIQIARESHIMDAQGLHLG
jgi:hypothetical protein